MYFQVIKVQSSVHLADGMTCIFTESMDHLGIGQVCWSTPNSTPIGTDITH